MMPTTTQVVPETATTDAHILIEVKGEGKKIALFHYVMGRMDVDWPWGAEEDRRDPMEEFTPCPMCGGMLYRMATMSAGEVKILGKQISELKEVPGNLKVKVHMWKLACPGVPAVLVNGKEGVQ